MGAALIALLLAAAPAAASHEAATLKDWALARCIGRAAGKPFQDDAYKSAAALLERSNADVEVFGRIDQLIDRSLKKVYGGSVPGRYDTLKCLDLYHGAALDRLTAGR